MSREPVNRSGMVAAALVVVALGFVGLRWFDHDADTGDEIAATYVRGDGVGRRHRRDAFGQDGEDWGDDDAGRARRGEKSSLVPSGRRGAAARDGGAGVRGGSQTVIEGSADSNSAKRGLGGRKSRPVGDAGGSRGLRGISRGSSPGGPPVTGGDSARLNQLRDRGPTGQGVDGLAAVDSLGGDAAPLDESEDEDGKLFDPLSTEMLKDEVDRGPEEDPSAVHKVDFLEDEGGVYAGEDSVLSFPAAGNIDGSEGTLNLVVEPDWNGDDEGSRSLLVVGEKNEWKNRIRVVKNNNYLRAMHFDSEGTERGIGIEIDDWRAGEQHQITVGWSAEQQRLTMYVDGVLVAERPLEGEIVFGSKATIEVGSAANREYRGAESKIFDLTTHDRLLAPGDL